MERDQSSFRGLMLDLSDLVLAFQEKRDLDARDDIAAEAAGLGQRLQDALEQAALFNSREVSRGRPPSPGEVTGLGDESGCWEENRQRIE